MRKPETSVPSESFKIKWRKKHGTRENAKPKNAALSAVQVVQKENEKMKKKETR